MNVVTISPVTFRVTLCVLSVAGLSVSLTSQENDGLRARQLYYKSKGAIEAEQKLTPDETGDKAGKNGKATSAPPESKSKTKSGRDAGRAADASSNSLGLKYAIEQGDASGHYVQVDPDKTFSTGDVIRLRMEVNDDAYVYLLTRGASGAGNFLFPQAGEENRLKAFRPVQVPSDGDPIRFDEPAGTETLYVLVSRTPVANFEKLLPSRGPSGAVAKAQAAEVPSGEFSDVVREAEAPQSRDLVRGKVKPNGGSASGDLNEHAVYVIKVSAAPGARIMQKIELKHR